MKGISRWIKNRWTIGQEIGPYHEAIWKRYLHTTTRTSRTTVTEQSKMIMIIYRVVVLLWHLLWKWSLFGPDTVKPLKPREGALSALVGFLLLCLICRLPYMCVGELYCELTWDMMKLESNNRAWNMFSWARCDHLEFDLQTDLLKWDMILEQGLILYPREDNHDAHIYDYLHSVLTTDKDKGTRTYSTPGEMSYSHMWPETLWEYNLVCGRYSTWIRPKTYT